MTWFILPTNVQWISESIQQFIFNGAVIGAPDTRQVVVATLADRDDGTRIRYSYGPVAQRVQRMAYAAQSARETPILIQ